MIDVPMIGCAVIVAILFAMYLNQEKRYKETSEIEWFRLRLMEIFRK